MSDSLFSDSELVSTWLERHFASEDVAADRLLEAMAYAALNGGKRLRGCLVISAGRCVAQITGSDVRMDNLLSIAGAVELLHAYSLIHDDLPAMDDAELRRGKPATHIAFDEATAILAGDALQTQAFSILASDELAIADDVKIALVATLARASGLAGMAGGQMLDLQAEDKVLDIAEIRQMQDLKTGALISASVLMGAQAQGATPPGWAAQPALTTTPTGWGYTPSLAGRTASWWAVEAGGRSTRGCRPTSGSTSSPACRLQCWSKPG